MKVHAMKWAFICRRGLEVCYVYYFLHIFISFKYDFYVDAEIMIKREFCKEISASMVKKIMYCMIPLP